MSKIKRNRSSDIQYAEALFQPLGEVRPVPIRFCETLNNESLPGLSTLFDVVVCDQLSGSRPVVFLEAKSNRGIVSTSTPGNHHVVRCGRHGPFACRCSSLSLLGARLRQLCEETSVLSADGGNVLIATLKDYAVVSDRSESLLRIVAHESLRSLSIVFLSSSFPFSVPVVFDHILTLREFDTLDTVWTAFSSGWEKGIDTNQDFSIPRCSDCRILLKSRAQCLFCKRDLCAKCLSRSRTCQECGRFCCLACSVFVPDSVARVLCPECAASSNEL